MAQLEEIGSHEGLTDTVRSSLFVGNSVFAGSGDLTGWDVVSNTEVNKYSEHERSIYCLAYIEQLIYSGSADKTFKSWDTRAPKSVHTFGGHTNTVRCISSFSLFDKNYLVSGSYDGTVKFWNLLTHSNFYTLQCNMGYVNCIAIDYPYLWVGGEGVAKQYNISPIFSNNNISQDKLQIVSEIKGHSEAVTSLHLYDDCVISASVDSSVKVWKDKPKKGYACLNTLQTNSPTAASIVCPELGSMFTCGSTIKVWGLEGMYCSFTSNAHTKPIRSLALNNINNNNNNNEINENKYILASGAQDKSQKLWKVVL